MKSMLAFPNGSAQKSNLLTTIAQRESVPTVEKLEESGVPIVFSYLGHQIFNGLDASAASSWWECFIKAIPVETNLYPIYHRFMAWMLADPNHGVIRFADERGCAVIAAGARAAMDATYRAFANHLIAEMQQEASAK